MALALFDLDNTLIAGDSDHGWGEFLCAHNYVDVAAYRAENDRFYRDYEAGTMDVLEYLRFSLSPLVANDAATLAAWHKQFMAEVIAPMMLPAAKSLLEQHRAAGDTIVVITSTNRFIVGPVVASFAIVDDLIATDPVIEGGRYNGEIEGVPCFREGKITKLREWLQGREFDLQEACFYSDSINDLPLMLEVGRPVAVDPDKQLRAEAERRGWSVMSLRD